MRSARNTLLSQRGKGMESPQDRMAIIALLWDDALATGGMAARMGQK